MKSLTEYINEELIQNEFNEKWEKLSPDHEAYKLVESAIQGYNNTDFGIMDVAECKGEYFIANLHGGLNGSGKWINYFEDLKSVFEKIGHAWLIDIKNDCLDDVFYVRFGFKINDKED